MKNKIIDGLLILSITHAICILFWFLIIPNLQLVYFNTPMYWNDWSDSRKAGLAAYLAISSTAAFLSTVIRFVK